MSIRSLFFVLLFCHLGVIGFAQEGGQADLLISDYEGLKPLFTKNNDTTYVINFWATWCGPCVKELPYFEALNEKYADQPVKVILVSLDFSNQIESKLIPFIEKRQLKSEVVVLNQANANAWIDQISADWSGAIPATLVYKGAKRQFYEGEFDSLESLNAIVKSFIKI